MRPGLLIGLQPDADYGLVNEVQPGAWEMCCSITPMASPKPAAFTGERFDEERLMRALLAICKTEWSRMPRESSISLFARLDRFVGPGSAAGGRCLDGGA